MKINPSNADCYHADVFFLLTPLQFFLVGMGWYGLYSILIPVYAFLFIPARIALAGDYKRFLERTAKIQAGLLICVYCLSYAPALLTLAPGGLRAPIVTFLSIRRTTPSPPIRIVALQLRKPGTASRRPAPTAVRHCWSSSC